MQGSGKSRTCLQRKPLHFGNSSFALLFSIFFTFLFINAYRRSALKSTHSGLACILHAAYDIAMH